MDSVDLLGCAPEEQLLTCGIKMGAILKIKENVKELNGSVAAAKNFNYYVSWLFRCSLMKLSLTIFSNGFLIRHKNYKSTVKNTLHSHYFATKK